MDTMRVEIVSNEQNIYLGEAKFVVVPTQTGELGIYPRHMPIMNLVRPGTVRITVPNQEQEVLLAVSGGLLEVRPDKLTILAEVAVRSDEMDQARAEEARKNAEERLKSATDAKSTAAAEAALAAAIAELKTLDYIRSQRHK